MKKEYYNFIKGYDNYYFERRSIELKRVLNTLSKSAKIFEGGCGSGNFLKFIYNQGFKNLYGLDINDELLDYAKIQCPNANITKGDVKKTNYKDNFFDVVLLMDVIEHLGDYDSAIKESHRILKKRGKLFITYPNPYLVPFFNFLGNIGLRVFVKDNQIDLKDIFYKSKDLFKVRYLKSSMLISKMPKPIIIMFEKFEKILGQKVLRKIGFFHTIILDKI